MLREIIEVLTPQLYLAGYALDTLETHFQHWLPVDAGSVTLVGTHAKQSRLQVSAQERAAMLDHIAERHLISITVDHVEQVI